MRPNGYVRKRRNGGWHKARLSSPMSRVHWRVYGKRRTAGTRENVHTGGVSCVWWRDLTPVDPRLLFYSPLLRSCHSHVYPPALHLTPCTTPNALFDASCHPPYTYIYKSILYMYMSLWILCVWRGGNYWCTRYTVAAIKRRIIELI